MTFKLRKLHIRLEAQETQVSV